MATLSDFTSDAAQRAMLEGLTTMVRDRLRERIAERIKPDIDAAVDAALATFETAINSYADPLRMRSVVEVIVSDRRGKAA